MLSQHVLFASSAKTCKYWRLQSFLPICLPQDMWSTNPSVHVSFLEYKEDEPLKRTDRLRFSDANWGGLARAPDGGSCHPHTVHLPGAGRCQRHLHCLLASVMFEYSHQLLIHVYEPVGCYLQYWHNNQYHVMLKFRYSFHHWFIFTIFPNPPLWFVLRLRASLKWLASDYETSDRNKNVIILKIENSASFIYINAYIFIHTHASAVRF